MHSVNRDSFLRTQAVPAALLTTGTAMAAFGGMGAFLASTNLPLWMIPAVEKIGTKGCQILLASGSVFILAGAFKETQQIKRSTWYAQFQWSSIPRSKGFAITLITVGVVASIFGTVGLFAYPWRLDRLPKTWARAIEVMGYRGCLALLAAGNTLMVIGEIRRRILSGKYSWDSQMASSLKNKKVEIAITGTVAVAVIFSTLLTINTIYELVTHPQLIFNMGIQLLTDP